jgi:hypothetical protein
MLGDGCYACEERKNAGGAYSKPAPRISAKICPSILKLNVPFFQGSALLSLRELKPGTVDAPWDWRSAWSASSGSVSNP